MTGIPRRVVLGVSGSVAATMAPMVATAIRLMWEAEVRAVLTHSATTFVTVPAMAVATGSPVVLPGSGGAAEGRVEHMELARWADLLLVAPATANLLGTVAHGLAPDPLTTCLLAYTGPVVLAPAMNPAMWANPRVQRNVALLEADGVGIVPPVTGTSAVDLGGGVGAMPPPPRLVRWLESWLRSGTADPAQAASGSLATTR